jgi:hypothetical protein
LLGALVLMGSISIIAIMSDAREEETTQSNGLMILFSVLAMCCLGIRAVTSKHCCQELGTPTFTMINFYADFGMGLLYFAMWGYDVV